MRDLRNRLQARGCGKLSAWCRKEKANDDRGWELFASPSKMMRSCVDVGFVDFRTCKCGTPFALFCTLLLYRENFRFALHRLITHPALLHSFALFCYRLQSFVFIRDLLQYFAFMCDL